MSTLPVVAGPDWSEKRSGRYSGRYPLAVERHMLQQVSRLLPGITTVTPHARYFTLHTLLSDEIESFRLKSPAAVDLLRRAEIALCAVSRLHSHVEPDAHAGLPGPHGIDKIRDAMDESGLDIDGLARPEGYAKALWGFRGQYLASEVQVGLIEVPSAGAGDRWSAGGMLPGPRAQAAQVREGLGAILDLARSSTLTESDLSAHADLCLCRIGEASDGDVLRSVLLNPSAVPESAGAHRLETARMLLRLIDLTHPTTPNSDLLPFVAFGDLLQSDPVLSQLQITRAWRGVALRAMSVNAWRSLWAFLVNDLEGLIPRSALADPLVATLPDSSVADFLHSLPSVFEESGAPAAAELTAEVEDLDWGAYELALLLLGAQRSGRLDRQVTPYFEGRDELGQELTPSWMKDRAEEWRHKSIRDFAVALVDRLVSRSQRVALSKASLSAADGVIKVPTRVFLRDDFVFRDSNEGGGPVGLRWNQFSTVLAPLGLLKRSNEEWHLTDIGRAYVT